jgi:hypothetical protein
MRASSAGNPGALICFLCDRHREAAGEADARLRRHGGARAQFLPGQWWMSTMLGLAIFVAVMGFNLLGDALRDALDVWDQ